MLKPRKTNKRVGRKDDGDSLIKITTYIAKKDYDVIAGFKSIDGSSKAKHYRAAMNQYVRRECRKRKLFR